MGTFLGDSVKNIQAAAGQGGGSSGGGSSGGGSSGGGFSGGLVGGLQLGAALASRGFSVGGSGGGTKNPGGQGADNINASGSRITAKASGRIGSQLVASGLQKMEQADRLQGLLDNATKDTGLMLGQWGNSREGAALTDRGLTGNIRASGEYSKDGSTSENGGKASKTTPKTEAVKPKTETVKPTAAALTPEQRTQRKPEVQEQNAQLEQDYRELNDRILYGRIGRDYTEEDVERLNSLYDKLQAKGADMVIAAYPIALCEGVPDEAQYAAFEQELRDKLKAEVISDFNSYRYDVSYFYDTHLHLTDEGVAVRTGQLAADVEKYREENQ